VNSKIEKSENVVSEEKRENAVEPMKTNGASEQSKTETTTTREMKMIPREKSGEIDELRRTKTEAELKLQKSELERKLVTEKMRIASQYYNSNLNALTKTMTSLKAENVVLQDENKQLRQTLQQHENQHSQQHTPSTPANGPTSIQSKQHEELQSLCKRMLQIMSPGEPSDYSSDSFFLPPVTPLPTFDLLRSDIMNSYDTDTEGSENDEYQYDDEDDDRDGNEYGDNYEGGDRAENGDGNGDEGNMVAVGLEDTNGGEDVGNECLVESKDKGDEDKVAGEVYDNDEEKILEKVPEEENEG